MPYNGTTINDLDISAPPEGATSLGILNDAIREIKKCLKTTFGVSHDLTRGTHLAFVDVVSYGAVGDGTTDDSAAISDAITALGSNAGILYFRPGRTYRITQTIYLTSSSFDATYIIMGGGYGSIIKIDSASDIYLFKVNEDSVGSKTIAYPHHPRAIFMNLQIDGSSSTGDISFCWYNEASVVMKNILFKGIKYGLNGTGYTDNITLDNIKWRDPKSGGWLYYQGGNGDSFYGKQLFTTDNDLIYLTKTAGGVLEACNGGHYIFNKCNSVAVRNGHFEHSNSRNSFTIIGSNVLLENNYIWDTTTYAPILLDEDTNYRTKMDVIIRDNIFVTAISANNTTKLDDIKIQDFSLYSTLTLQNNKCYIYETSRWIFEKAGIKVSATDITLNTLISDNIEYLTGNVALLYKNGAWVIEGTLLDGRPYNSIQESFLSINAPSIGYIGESSNYPSSLTAGTYYYKIAFYQKSKSTAGSAEASVTTSADNKSVYLVFPVYPHTICRIWRGTLSGSYDRYVDIPMIGGSVELYDQGDCIAGYAWETTGIPSVPLANTTANELVLKARFATNQTASATTLGSVSHKFPIYDENNALIGYIPVYDSIT
jgi:hypothetical protein